MTVPATPLDFDRWRPPTWDEVRCYFTREGAQRLSAVGARLDLADYDSVRVRADALVRVVESERMPWGDPPWSREKLERFRLWVCLGCPR